MNAPETLLGRRRRGDELDGNREQRVIEKFEGGKGSMHAGGRTGWSRGSERRNGVRLRGEKEWIGRCREKGRGRAGGGKGTRWVSKGREKHRRAMKDVLGYRARGWWGA